MTARTTLVIPADRLASLEVPALAVDTGGTDPVWVDIPLGGVFGAGTMRVPLAARTVKAARRRVLEFRYRPVVGWLLFAAYLVATEVFIRSDDGTVFPVVLIGLMMGIWFGTDNRRPAQVPYRTYLGEVVLPEMDPATARRWTEANPDVRMTGKTVTRAHSPRFYAVWAVVLLLGSIGAGVLLANDGHEQSVAVWFALPVIFVSGVRTALRIRPHRALRYAR